MLINKIKYKKIPHLYRSLQNLHVRCQIKFNHLSLGRLGLSHEAVSSDFQHCYYVHWTSTINIRISSYQNNY